MMPRTAASKVFVLLCLAFLGVGCSASKKNGNGLDPKLLATTRAAAETFLRDLAAGRTEALMAKTTKKFQKEYPAAALSTLTQKHGVLADPNSLSFVEATSSGFGEIIYGVVFAGKEEGAKVTVTVWVDQEGKVDDFSVDKERSGD
jgi:hypothetical protein